VANDRSDPAVQPVLRLAGRAVVVTRAADQAPALVDRLKHHGATAVVVPLIEVVEPADGGRGLRDAVARCTAGDYRWVVVSSPNGAARIIAGLRGPDDLGGARLCAIGPATADVLTAGGLHVDLTPPQFVAESVLGVMDPPDPADRAPRVLIPRAAVARDVLPDGLAAMGWQVDVVEAYRTVPARVDPAVADVVRRADAITFTSSSTVDRFVEVLGLDALPPVAVCIGPVTAATARGHGIAGVMEADEHTLDGVLDALIDAIGIRSGPSTDEPGSTGP
jgi:uroporphyrinogen III methyltransferase/synthase